MMKAVVVTCFESNDERVGLVHEVLTEKGFDIKVFSSDFSHTRKTKRTDAPEYYELIETRPYRKNLSLERMYSHRCFAKDVFGKIEEEGLGLIWLMIPANSLMSEARRYKEKHPEVKLITDVIDMWPESLPLSISSNVFPLNVWRNVRRNNIACSNVLVSECEFYKGILAKEYGRDIKTLYWARDARAESREDYGEDKLSLCYIGSINNIIDIDRIVRIVSQIDMPVDFHVIGEGEKQEEFVQRLGEVSEVTYHGPVRDEEKKSGIFSRVHAGINIYREDLYIGLTVKCIDYFGHGLPIINNIKGDTWNFVEKYGAGINVTDDLKIDGKKLIGMRKDNRNILDLYDNNFTKKEFISRCSEVIDEVNG